MYYFTRSENYLKDDNLALLNPSEMLLFGKLLHTYTVFDKVLQENSLLKLKEKIKPPSDKLTEKNIFQLFYLDNDKYR